MKLQNFSAADSRNNQNHFVKLHENNQFVKYLG